MGVKHLRREEYVAVCVALGDLGMCLAELGLNMESR